MAGNGVALTDKPPAVGRVGGLLGELHSDLLLAKEAGEEVAAAASAVGDEPLPIPVEMWSSAAVRFDVEFFRAEETLKLLRRRSIFPNIWRLFLFSTFLGLSFEVPVNL